MADITPNLWFDGVAEEAAEFYTALFPDSRINDVMRAPADHPSGEKGAVLAVNFTLLGRGFTGINGGPRFSFSEAVSFAVDCGDQAEIDRYWAALTAEGGAESMCGWCKDRFGVSWQVVPRRLPELLGAEDRDAAERVARAMLEMRKLDIAALEAAAAG
jgi:predicted 3-demethylubiquinone-9 3-methyltransferase (glyoxalase superfamily)